MFGNTGKKIQCVGGVLAALTLVVFIASVFSGRISGAGAAQGEYPKYVFLFLADGAGIPHMEIGRASCRERV